MSESAGSERAFVQFHLKKWIVDYYSLMRFFNKITKTLFSSWTYSGHLAWFYFIYQFKHRTLDLLLTTMISIRVHSIATPIMTGCWKCEFDCLAFVKIYRKKKYENYKYNTLLNTPKRYPTKTRSHNIIPLNEYHRLNHVCRDGGDWERERIDDDREGGQKSCRRLSCVEWWIRRSFPSYSRLTLRSLFFVTRCRHSRFFIQYSLTF